MPRKRSAPASPIPAVVILASLALLAIPATKLPNLTGLFYLFAFLIVFVLAAGTVFVLILKKRESDLLSAISISEVDTMSGEKFESYIAQLLYSQGYKIRLTPSSGDFGADIIASKGQDKFSIQTKRYSHDSVDRTAVSDAVAAMKYYQCNRSMVVTSSFFSPSAIDFAKQHQCVLVDRNELGKWILGLQKQRS